MKFRWFTRGWTAEQLAEKAKHDAVRMARMHQVRVCKVCAYQAGDHVGGTVFGTLLPRQYKQNYGVCDLTFEQVIA